MLAINAIRNVNNTLNNNISFGYRSNELVKAPTYSNDMVEGNIGGLFTGFVGTLKSSPLFDSKTEMDFLLLRQYWRVFQCHRKVLDLFVFQYDDFIFTFFQQCAG